MSTLTSQPSAANGKSQPDDIGDRAIVYRPFMGKSDVTLTANTVLRLIAKPTKSGKMPTIVQCIRFAKLCEARGLDPWEGDAYLVGYDASDGAEFNLITAHQAFLKRAETHPEYDGMESGVVVASNDGVLTDQAGDFLSNDQTLAGGWARIHFKNRRIPTYRRINLSTFDTKRSRWAKDPAGMIVKCAEADALRSSFPNSLGGMYLREEFDATIESTPRTPVPMPKALAAPVTNGAPKHQPPTNVDPSPEPSDQQPPKEESQMPSEDQGQGDDNQAAASDYSDITTWAAFVSAMESRAQRDGISSEQCGKTLGSIQVRKGWRGANEKKADPKFLQDMLAGVDAKMFDWETAWVKEKKK